MKLNIFQLHFTAPLHLSDIRADYGKSERMLHSDTLTAAIMQAWAALGKEEWIKPDTGFVVSSLFPFTRSDQKTVYFLPKPYTGLNTPSENTDTSLAKKAKKVQYFDTDYFDKALLRHVVNPAEDSYQGAYLTDTKIDAHFLLSDVRIRIRKPRNEAEDAEPFYMEQLIFKQGSGFWGMIQFDNDEAQKRFELGIQYLQDAGLGTDRNVGNGQFRFVWDTITKLPFGTEQSEYGICLSLFCPESPSQLSQMLDTNARYDTVKRGGWLSEPYNTLRKRSVWMFKEGSVFKMPEQKNVFGNVVNLRPDILPQQRPVWRSGKAIFLPINWKG